MQNKIKQLCNDVKTQLIEKQNQEEILNNITVICNNNIHKLRKEIIKEIQDNLHKFITITEYPQLILINNKNNRILKVEIKDNLNFSLVYKIYPSDILFDCNYNHKTKTLYHEQLTQYYEYGEDKPKITNCQLDETIQYILQKIKQINQE